VKNIRNYESFALIYSELGIFGMSSYFIYICRFFCEYASFEVAYLRDRNNDERLELVMDVLVVDRRADIRYYYPFGWAAESTNL